MARFSNGSSGRLGKRSRNASETASLSSWGSSEVNVLSDSEEKKRDLDYSGKAGSSSDEEESHHSISLASRGKRPKCFSRNAVLARQNRQKKKKYVEDLENELQTLRKENVKLKVSVTGYSKDIELVRKENIYLRNVLANSPEICQLIRTVNINSSSLSHSQGSDVKRPDTGARVPSHHPGLETAVPSTDSCVPTSRNTTAQTRTVRKDFPIAVDDVSLSLSAPEDDDDDLDILFGSKDTPMLDLGLDASDADYLGFGPNTLGDWLDGDEPLAHVGVCLHVAKNKVSLEFCSSCNESAFAY